MKFDAWALTDLGNVRENNEDSHLVDVENGVFVVADGVGGSEAGEVASDHLVQRFAAAAGEIQRLANEADPVSDRVARERVFKFILELLQDINREVYDIGKEINPTLPSATTCDLLVMSRNCAFIAHVGDSRIYLFRQQQVFRITEDHTFAEQLKREAVADERILERFRNVLTRSIGGKPQVEIDALFIDLQPGDQILMCSDGVTDYLSGQEILDFANQRSGEELVQLLIREAKDRGGADNITAMSICIKGASAQTSLHDPSFDTLEQADILGNIALFEGLALQELIKVLRIVYERRFAHGEAIMTAGEPSDCLYVVGDGEVFLRHHEQPPIRLGEGQHFGVLALMSEELRTSSAHAVDDTLVLVVPAIEFRELVEDDPIVGNKLLWNLLNMLGDEIRELRQRPIT